MKNTTLKKSLLRACLLAVLTAAALWPGLFTAAGAEAFRPVTLPAGALAEVDLGRGETVFDFTAPTGSVYDIWLFPVEEEPPQAKVELWRDGRMLAESAEAMPAVSLRLTAGARYELRLCGSGRGRLEVARHALSRCYDKPMLLDDGGDAYSKAFAREGDVHWFAVDARDDATLALVGMPEEDGIRLNALLFDDEGHLLEEAVPTAGGACLADISVHAGRRCYIRLSSEDGATGLYTLQLARLQGGVLPDRVTMARQSLTLEGRMTVRLLARVSPEGAGGILYWESSDPRVASVDAEGRVSGRDVGTAVITAYGAGGESDSCRVEVRRVPVSGVSLLSGRISMSVGDDTAVECEVQPANASDPALSYSARPEGIVSVDRRGVLRGLSVGTARVRVQSLDGGFTDELTVEVGPAPRRWRALLVGEQNYASTVAAVRTGSLNSVSGLRSMLENLSFDGARFRVNTLLDASRDGVLAAIRRVFDGAGDEDVALFYITCHGEYIGGMTRLMMFDGSVLTAVELAAALRQVPGELLVVIDCCGSGGVIGKASDTGDILKGIDAVFGGNAGPAVMSTSRFRVLASAALEQESYRLSFGDDAGEAGMATVFARALCEAGGWNIDRAARGAMRADADYDGVVTLNELYVYVARRVMWYLTLTGSPNDTAGRYVQSVQVWPEGDGTEMFVRRG